MKKTIMFFCFCMIVLMHPLFAAQQFANFTLEDINGDRIDSENLLDKKAIVIDFWATWCSPCKKALPALSHLTEKYKDDIYVVCISIDKARDKDKAISMVKSKKYSFITLFDPSKKVAGMMNVTSIPRTYIIDQNRQIMYDHSGYTQGDEHELETELRKIIYKDISADEAEALYPEDMRPELVNYVEPLYPELALQEKVETDIVLDFEILEDGSIGQVCFVTECADSTYGFEQAVMDAVEEWKFSPVQTDDTTLKARFLYPIKFRMENE